MTKPTEAYRTYSDADKIALTELRKEASEKLKQEIKLGDMIAAVEPNTVTPSHLKGQ